MWTNKQKSERQERRIAQDLSGRTTPGSGSRWGARRDVRSDQWLVEAKTTVGDRFSVPLRELLYLRHQACNVGLEPAFIVEFQGRGERVLVPQETLHPVTTVDTPVLVEVTGRAVVVRWEETDRATLFTIPNTPRALVFALIPYRQFLQL